MLSIVEVYLSGQDVNLTEQTTIAVAKIYTIIEAIKNINPNAKIYIMGYYNALPNLDSQQEALFLQPLVGFNKSIKDVVDFLRG